MFETQFVCRYSFHYWFFPLGMSGCWIRENQTLVFPPLRDHRVWVIRVLLGFSSSPNAVSHWEIKFLQSLITSKSGWRTTKSSAYLTNCGFQFSLPFFSGYWLRIYVSNPCKAIFASNGLITPPCGVPSGVGNRLFPSITPAFSHPRMTLAASGNVFNFLSNSSWLILSKHLAMSASRTNLDFWAIAVKIASIASWAERPGLKPYEFGSNSASYSGSKAILRSACNARSCIVGMPKGRFSALPGLGIQTLLTALILDLKSIALISWKRWAGVRDLTPSTPAVFFPWLSCVTRLTDKHLAHQDFISSRWSLWTLLISPLKEAR